MRTLAIDLGTKRVGLALSDEGGKLATPYAVLSVISPQDAMRQVMEVIEREGVRRIALGLPLNMDDTIGPAARSAVAWGRRLGEKAAIPVLFIDERLSSFAAERQLVDRKRSGEKITRGQKKDRLDALAAAMFLQEFLDGRIGAMRHDLIEGK